MNKKGIILGVITLSVLLLSLFGCGKKEAAVNSADTKTFTVGFDAEYPPFGYMADDGTYTGFDLELAEEVCKMEGWELIKQPIDWDSKDMEINSGNIDCIWNGFTMTGREDDYEWTIPYIDNSVVIVVKKDSDIKAIEDLKGKYIITQAGSSAYASLTNEEDEDMMDLTKSFSKLEVTPDFNTAFMNLESGIGDAIAVDISVAKYQLKNKPDKFRMLEENISSEQYAVGFKKGNTELRDIVENDIIELNKKGVVAKVADKYQEYSVKDMLCLD